MSEPAGEIVFVHSVQEEYFHMMVHPCACGGAWLGQAQDLENIGKRLLHHVTAKCFRCGSQRKFLFDLTQAGPQPTAPTAIREINPTGEPSRAVDPVEWMDLARFYLERIARLRSPVERAQSLLDARQCAEEAMKFHGPTDEAPPPAALWSDASRRKAAKQPNVYSRSALVAMLERMPPIRDLRKADALDQKVFEKALKAEAQKRVGKWWQVWKRLKRGN